MLPSPSEGGTLQLVRMCQHHIRMTSNVQQPTGDAPLLQLQAQQDNWQHEIERQHGVINYPYLCIELSAVGKLY